MRIREINRTVVVQRLAVIPQWLPRDAYFWLKALLLTGIAIQLARLFWAVTTPIGPFGPWRPAEARILAPAAQMAIVSSFDPFFRGASPDSQLGQVTSLNLILFGVRENRSTGTGGAIIAGPDGVQASYAVGEEVVPGAVLAAVAFDYVVIERGGQREKLFMDQSKPAEIVVGGAPASTTPLVPAAPLGGGAVTAAALKQGIAFAPRIEGGRVTGVLLSALGDDAVFRAAGLQPGDIVTSVNGSRVTSAASLASLQAQIAPGARLSLTVERGASSVPIALNLAGN